MDNHVYRIAYFSMEIAVEPEIPTYSGGLGILAGDLIAAAAQAKVPLVACTLLYRKGYFQQQLDPRGIQRENPVEWEIKKHLTECPERVAIEIDKRTVWIRAWKYEVTGSSGGNVPVYFLDTDLNENAEDDRKLTSYLYGGDQYYRLCQECVLGIGGVRFLRKMGYAQIDRFHMNEGHASLLTLELLDEAARAAGRQEVIHDDVNTVRAQCIFTTHTPVPAAQDQFTIDLIRRVLGPRKVFEMEDVICCDGLINLTFLALNFSHYINGVAKHHGDITRLHFARYTIDAITNGVHVPTWTSPPFQVLFDRFISGWRDDNFSLRYALRIPKSEVWQAHIAAKEQLLKAISKIAHVDLNPEVLTIGFARRATAYKRADLIFRDMDRLKAIATTAGPLQIIFGGKAHPQDLEGKQLIKRIFEAKEHLRDVVKIVYLEDYKIELAKLMTAGVDVWLNTPQPPLEASGTSGMKAAVNGVPSLSVLDGWWAEGCIEGLTGWAIGEVQNGHDQVDFTHDEVFLYDKLEKEIIPLFYHQREEYISVMRHCIALNGSFFNAQRMIQQYVLKAYFP